MTEANNYEIKNNVLIKYIGTESTLILPNGIKEIAKYAISGNNNIKTIKIPQSVEKIDEYGFSFSANVKEIIVDDNNPYFTSINGVLYSKDKSVLVMVPEGIDENYEIPSFVTKIGDFAFTGCKNIKEIKIPSSVTLIGFGTFTACSSLTDITISENVNEIGNDCFIDSPNLTIHAPKGSYAEFFAQITNIAFIKL